jgi:predicted ABC-type ATPase
VTPDDRRGAERGDPRRAERGREVHRRAVPLPKTLRITEFVNADTIARGLSGFNPESAALQAGKIMLRRLRELATDRASFAFETTLASRSFARWLGELDGYRSELIYLWLPDVSLAVQRVRDRVSRGGHAIPEEDIRRRYRRSLVNLRELYIPAVSPWRVYNAAGAAPVLVASGGLGPPTVVVQEQEWNRIIGNERRRACLRSGLSHR